MALASDCHGCRNGHHEFHVEVVRKGIPGLYGSGHYCYCKGDCAERNRVALEAERQMYLAIIDAVDIRGPNVHVRGLRFTTCA